MSETISNKKHTFTLKNCSGQVRNFEKMKLSVIIPVYQSAHCVQRCVRSVIAASPDGCEIILVDDGSTDGGGAICDELAAESTDIQAIHRQNGGLSAARNTGIDASAGDYITFIDSDDEIAPDTLSANFRYLQEHTDTDLLEYPVNVHFGSSRSRLLQFEPHAISGHSITVFRQWVRENGNEHAYACNKIFRRSLFDTVRFPEGETFEDIAICPSIVRNCRKIYFSDQGLYLYYANNDGITMHYRFRSQEPLFRHNLELLTEISVMSDMEREYSRLWSGCLNLLADLCRCRDTDREYTDRAAARLSSLRPSVRAFSGSASGIKACLKYVFTLLFGVRAYCRMAGTHKLPL